MSSQKSMFKYIKFVLLCQLPWTTSQASNSSCTFTETNHHQYPTSEQNYESRTDTDNENIPFSMAKDDITTVTNINSSESIVTQTKDNVTRIGQTTENNSSKQSNASDTKPHHTVHVVMAYISYITMPILLVTSLGGNTITLIVMFSKAFRNNPYSLLLIALAFSDSIYSMVYPLSKLYVRELIGYDPRAFSDFGCNLFFIVHKASKICSSWFVVAICVERFVAIMFPLRARILCSKRNTFIAVLVITTSIIIFTSLWTFSTRIVDDVCIPNYASPRNAMLAKAFLVAGSLVFSVIPAAILLILTPIICFKLHRQMKLRRTMSSANNKEGSESRANVMLLWVTMAYIILVVPTAVAHNVFFTLNISLYESKQLSASITRFLIQGMEQLNYSINFFLYIVCNCTFRRRVLRVLGCIRTSGNLSSSSSSRDSSGKTRTRSVQLTDIQRT